MPPATHEVDAGSSEPVFEGFAVEMAQPGQEQALRELIEQELGPNWRVTPFGDRATDFEVTSDASGLSVQAAWQATYRLRGRPGVVYAEPVFVVSIMNRQEWNAAAPTSGLEGLSTDAVVSQLCGNSVPVPESSNTEWSLQTVRVFEAWQRFFPGQTAPGQGIVVGHPDTGYHRHPEILSNLLSTDGFDYVKNDADALDELEAGTLLNPGHGTGTASVIISPRGGAAGSGITGVAPGAKLIPLRVSRSVVLGLSTFNLAHAIEHATDRGAHVISMSLGGTFNWRLRKAILYAQTRGVILLAAAGNCVRFVTWPAAYDEVIAVAACNAQLKTWRGSSRGSKVDVTAPGESVWCARVNSNGTTIGYDIAQGSGTSYAVATVAGVAVLWLAHHGRANLIARYGIEKIPFIFNQILRSTATPIHNASWEPGKFGTGLVNAEAVLDAPLPGTLESLVVPPAVGMEQHVPVDNGGEETFRHLFEESLTERGRASDGLESTQAVSPLRSRLAELLNTTGEEVPTRLREVGQELAFYLSVDPALYTQFVAALRAPASTSSDGGLESVTTNPHVEAMREELLGRGVSPALENKIVP